GGVNEPGEGGPVPGGPALYSLLMALFGRSRSRPAKDAAARDLLERLRWRYFQVTPGVRFLGGVLLTGLAVSAAVVLDGPVLVVAAVGVGLLIVVHLTLR